MKRRPLKSKGTVGLCPACHTDRGDPPETMRDRHARAALIGILSNPNEIILNGKEKTKEKWGEVAADRCYQWADSMMKARKK